MRHIPASISKKTARSLFERKSAWARFWGALIPPEVGMHTNLPRQELINFPYYIVEVGLRTSKGPGSVLVSVEAWSGAFAFFEQEDALVKGEPEIGECFAPKIGPKKAAELAEEELLNNILRQRSRGEKPYTTGAIRSECILYPIWLHYFELRRGKISLLVRDAIVGAPMGNRTRNGILQAFIEKQKG